MVLRYLDDWGIERFAPTVSDVVELVRLGTIGLKTPIRTKAEGSWARAGDEPEFANVIRLYGPKPEDDMAPAPQGTDPQPASPELPTPQAAASLNADADADAALAPDPPSAPVPPGLYVRMANQPAAPAISPPSAPIPAQTPAPKPAPAPPAAPPAAAPQGPAAPVPQARPAPPFVVEDAEPQWAAIGISEDMLAPITRAAEPAPPPPTPRWTAPARDPVEDQIDDIDLDPMPQASIAPHTQDLDLDPGLDPGAGPGRMAGIGSFDPPEPGPGPRLGFDAGRLPVLVTAPRPPRRDASRALDDLGRLFLLAMGLSAAGGGLMALTMAPAAGVIGDIAARIGLAPGLALTALPFLVAFGVAWQWLRVTAWVGGGNGLRKRDLLRDPAAMTALGAGALTILGFLLLGLAILGGAGANANPLAAAVLILVLVFGAAAMGASGRLRTRAGA